MTDEDHRAAGTLRHVAELFHQRAHLIGAVHVDLAAEEGLQRIEDNEAGTGFAYRLLDPLVGNGWTSLSTGFMLFSFAIEN